MNVEQIFSLFNLIEHCRFWNQLSTSECSSTNKRIYKFVSVHLVHELNLGRQLLIRLVGFA